LVLGGDTFKYDPEYRQDDYRGEKENGEAEDGDENEIAIATRIGPCASG
jgi:hypothetical protein